ncbi:MAG: hypothetical protein NUV67_01655, partial [archaeon]|nr:hypothetical protein [archaeon]
GVGDKVKGELWFKVDPFILHIGTNTMEKSKNILSAMKKAGVKRGGIMVAEPGKFLIELQGTEKMEFPLCSQGELLVGKKYLEQITPKANEMLEKNYSRLAKLEKEFSRLK